MSCKSNQQYGYMNGRRAKSYFFSHVLRQFLLLCAALIFGDSPLIAQISAGGTPPSFSGVLSNLVPTAVMPPVDEQLLRAEDEAESSYGRVDDPRGQRFAFAHDVNLNLPNSGLWETDANGDRIWRLRVESVGARSIHLLYDRWRLAKGARLFIYNDDRSHVTGAFTADNNWTDGTNITGPVFGSAVTLEYVVPQSQQDIGELSILQICHAYRSFAEAAGALDNFGDANSCQVNVACAEGNNWQDEKRGVAMIISNVRWCSGSLIQNTREDFWPYFLTANHCVNGSLPSWLFIFNYESPTCLNPGSEPSISNSVANAALVSSWGLNPGSDFALLRLSSPPPISYTPYYNGWDRSNTPAVGTRSIHHPSGDIKKINRDDGTAVSDYWTNTSFPNTHWRIPAWEVGGNEGGSSGSVCFDQNSRIKGQLTGGYEACAANDASWYGKFSHSWNGGGVATARLKDWIDPESLAVFTMDGAYPAAPAYDNCEGFEIGIGTSPFPFSHSAYTTYSTDHDRGECAEFPGPDNVYHWTAQCPTSVTVSLCGGSSWDTGLYVREDDCTLGTMLACNDDQCGLQSELSFTAAAGREYFIVVDGFSPGSYGLYTLIVGGTALCAPESLVVQALGPDILLDWISPIGETGVSQYNIYRADTPEVPVIPVNLIGTSTTRHFTDPGILEHASERFFYTVTAASLE